MRDTRLLTLILALFVAAPAGAAELDYNFIDIGWISTDVDVGPGDVDGDGFTIEGSLALADRVHVIGGLAFQEFDLGIDINSQRIGIGFNTPLTETVDFVASGELIRVDIETNFGDDDDTGYGINIGVRGLASEQLEFSGIASFVDVTESDFGISFAGIYYPAPQWGIGASVSLSDDSTSYGLGARFYFRK